MLEAAVLLEANWQDLVDQIWVCVVEPHIAIARATQRDGVDAAAIQDRIDAQLSNAERTELADEIIDNSGSQAELLTQLDNLWDKISQSPGANA